MWERNLRKARKAKGSWTWYWGNYQVISCFEGVVRVDLIVFWKGGRNGTRWSRKAFTQTGDNREWTCNHQGNTETLKVLRGDRIYCVITIIFVSFVVTMTWKALCDPSWAYFSSRFFLSFSPLYTRLLFFQKLPAFFFSVPICCYFGEPITLPFTLDYILRKLLPCTQGWL